MSLSPPSSPSISPSAASTLCFILCQQGRPHQQTTLKDPWPNPHGQRLPYHSLCRSVTMTGPRWALITCGTLYNTGLPDPVQPIPGFSISRGEKAFQGEVWLVGVYGIKTETLHHVYCVSPEGRRGQHEGRRKLLCVLEALGVGNPQLEKHVFTVTCKTRVNYLNF